MRKLVEQVQAGEKGAAEVLLDFLLEQGIERETVLCFVNTMAWGGPAVPQVRYTSHPIVHQYRSQPWTYFDTVEVGGPIGSRFTFFTHFPGGQQSSAWVKTEAHSNMVQVKRIPSYDRFRCTRISLEGLPLPEDAELRVRINQFDLLDTSVNSLLARGIWGAPALLDISDRDDLNAHVRLMQAFLATPFTLKLSLHGWRERPLGF